MIGDNTLTFSILTCENGADSLLQLTGFSHVRILEKGRDASFDEPGLQLSPGLEGQML